jgi:hypothetical protein
MGIEWAWLKRARQRIVLELDGELSRCIGPVTRFLGSRQQNASAAGRLSIKG